MKKNNSIFISIFSLLVLLNAPLSLAAQSISEKKALLRQYDSDFDLETSALLREVNQEIKENKDLLLDLHLEAQELFKYGASENLFEELLRKIQRVRQSIVDIQEEWRVNITEKGLDESYSTWNLPDTTLGQLIIDYGTSEYIYLIPPDVASVKLSINSSLPLPRESWEKVLFLILESNGIGIKQRNSFLKELYFLQENYFGTQHITNNRNDLPYYPEHARICFILDPKTIEIKEAQELLEKFANPQHTSFHLVGKSILILSTVEPLLELLKVYDFIEKKQPEKEYRIIPLKKIAPDEMEKILLSIFQSDSSSNELTNPPQSLRILTLKNHLNSLFISGPKEDVQKSIDVIHSLEEQMISTKEKTVFWYTANHSSAEDLAKVLSKVYPLMLTQDSSGSSSNIIEEQLMEAASQQYMLASSQNTSAQHLQFGNFIVDAKTGSLLMVVEKQLIPQLKELLHKLDIPKKMVRIEALLVEKKVKNSNHLGINLLKMGSKAELKHSTGLVWAETSAKKGILDFFLSRQKTDTGIPAYDLTYRFLLSHEDIQVNASPSITTVNQTPAKIEIVEEISINTGTNVIKDDSANSVLQDSFTRADYGIIIEVTPNIHLRSDDNKDDSDFITLSTDIRFDSTSASSVSRPDVTKRHIKNEVRIADGQTVIIGGLRRKDIGDNNQKVPFLGELPGIGKIFGSSEMNDSKTEMFIFLTPKIISDPSEEFEKIKIQELKKRPGDLPEFLRALEQAQQMEKSWLMEGTFTMLFGRPEKAQPYYGEFDGKE